MPHLSENYLACISNGEIMSSDSTWVNSRLSEGCPLKNSAKCTNFPQPVEVFEDVDVNVITQTVCKPFNSLWFCASISISK